MLAVMLVVNASAWLVVVAAATSHKAISNTHSPSTARHANNRTISPKTQQIPRKIPAKAHPGAPLLNTCDMPVKLHSASPLWAAASFFQTYARIVCLQPPRQRIRNAATQHPIRRGS